LLNKGVGIVVIDDSNKQAAAELLCTQVWRYCHEEEKAGFRLRFDKDIIEDRKRLADHLRGLYPPCVGLSEHDSECEQLVQCADFLAGAIRLKVDFGLGRRDPNTKVTVDGDAQDSKEEIELSFYFFAALRYCLWGRVRDVGDEPNVPYPTKSVLGQGFVINSSLPRDLLDKAVSFVDGDYMGCIH
jgi:hypothetical protein